MRDRRCRSRLHRDPMLTPLVPQQRDFVILRDLFFYRFAATPALFLSAYWANGGQGMQYVPKRLTQLWRAGLTERFTAHSRYLHGSRPLLYTLGSGKASAAARTGLRPIEIDAERWRHVLAEAAPARERVRDALLVIGIAPAEVDRVLHNNTELALKFYAGETSGVRHHVLAAEALSVLWFSARMHGWPVEDIQPDGVADLSFREPEPHLHRDLVTNDGCVPIKPDGCFTIAGHVFALEAETGTSSASKVRLKLRRYARLLARPHTRADQRRASRDASFRILFHCATAAHAHVVADAIAAVVPPPLTGAFVVSTATELSANCGDSYDALSRCLTARIFHQLIGGAWQRVALFGSETVYETQRASTCVRHTVQSTEAIDAECTRVP